MISNSLLNSEFNSELLNDEFFLSLGESIVIDLSLVFQQLSKLEYKKPFAKEEVFRKLTDAKNLIDDCFFEKPHSQYNYSNGWYVEVFFYPFI